MTNTTKYHVNKETGRAGICKATKKGCPLGEDTPHFQSKEGAKKFIENTEKANNYQFATMKKVPKKKENNLTFNNNAEKNYYNNLNGTDKKYYEKIYHNSQNFSDPHKVAANEVVIKNMDDSDRRRFYNHDTYSRDYIIDIMRDSKKSFDEAETIYLLNEDSSE